MVDRNVNMIKSREKRVGVWACRRFRASGETVRRIGVSAGRRLWGRIAVSPNVWAINLFASIRAYKLYADRFLLAS
jgi:hypothetical protein